jgi:uncharacterized protein YoaH (UPF0181 family)
VAQIEAEGFYRQANYAFDQGVLSHPLTTLIESNGKHWVSEIEKTRLILWNGQWQQVQSVAQVLRQEHPESFQHKQVRCRNGEIRQIWAFSKVVRLKKFGQRLYSLSREALQQVVEFTQSLLNQGKSLEQVMEVLIPA